MLCLRGRVESRISRKDRCTLDRSAQHPWVTDFQQFPREEEMYLLRIIYVLLVLTWSNSCHFVSWTHSFLTDPSVTLPSSWRHVLIDGSQ